MELLKKISNKLHLWLGLFSAIVIFIVSITGCIYAFQDEIQNVTKKHRWVEVRNEPFIKPSRLIDVAQKALPDKKVYNISYKGADRSAEVIFYNYNPKYYYKVSVNPYTAEVLHIEDINKSFFRFIIEGHFYLWLPSHIGSTVVKLASLSCLILVISGFILWIPKKRKQIKQRLKIEWTKKTRWRRKNYDIHSVGGVYIVLIAVILSLTGLAFGSDAFSNVYYKMFGGNKSISFNAPLSSDNYENNLLAKNLDILYTKAYSEHKEIKSLDLYWPYINNSSIIMSISDNYYHGMNSYYYYDANTLSELKSDTVYQEWKDINLSDKIFRLTYDIHTGGIFGIFGKAIMFFASLGLAISCVSGVMIYYGRKVKDKK